MRTYKALQQQAYHAGEYSLVPVRQEDRYLIMQWRNEQIYHLRQTEPLTREQQDAYFDNVIDKLFDLEKPDQILFSFLRAGECIGYGGLVHINWVDRNAEISFLLNPDLDNDRRKPYWDVYLSLIDEVGFMQVGLIKLYTYAYDVRDYIYPIIESNGYEIAARFQKHKIVNGAYVDVLIHEKLNPNE